ncbi:hypothetical protein F4780DRAFT_778948 [Xylariomycetidae sp. FL0641]|nr:hypothetical protein F4780DRAFT_778948 [Xylariomycetidae sp. FL0641]
MPTSSFDIEEPGRGSPWTIQSPAPPPYEASSPPAQGIPESPSRRQRWRYYADRTISRLALPLAILSGSAITAGSTFALAKHVTNAIANAKVSDDPVKWMQMAKKKDYEPCYNGCTDCNDPSFAYRACMRTSEIHAKDDTVICDGRKLWNWAIRYPSECLAARGEFYREKALKDLKTDYKARWALIILTVIAGLVGAGLVYWTWAKLTAKRRTRAEQMIRDWPGWRTQRRAKREQSSWKKPFVFFLAMCGRGAAAYHCTGRHEGHYMDFANQNQTIYARARGWISECYDKEVCWDSYEPFCISNSCTPVMREYCIDETYVSVTPEQYLQIIEPRIAECGFKRVSLLGADTSLRLASPGLERDWRVRIDVNGYNVTDPEETDAEILCLHDIGGF